ncbi:endoribonuclease Dicer-like [Octopus vulgaris]|nr:endoribonuclease Dicer-like [Octopus vulgaris]
MVKAAYDPVRKLPRYLRTEDLPVHTFTPQTYQLELLDAALHQNTIVCVNSPPGKTFIAVMLIKEMAIQIRPMVPDIAKRKFTVFLVSSVNVESQAKVVCHHTDLSVGYYTDDTEITADQADKWIPELLTHQVFVTTASVFLNILQCEFLSLNQVNLLLIDECSDICVSESHKEVMKIYEKCEKNLQPRIVVLTAVLLSSKCRDPNELENTINKLESIFHSVAETSTLVFSERHGTSPKENVLECNSDFDEIQQMPEVSMILQESLFFIDECILSEKEKENIKDPLQVPRTALAQCLNILDVLGPWCANHIAEMFIKQLEKIIGHEQSEIGKLLLRYTTTQLRIVTKTFEKLFNIDYCIDDFLPFLTPKVIKLVNILRGYKPEFEFVILRDENADGMEHSDDDTMDDLSDSDSDDYVNSSHHKNDLHITLKHPAAARAEYSDSDPLEQEEEKRLCGLIFVDCKYVAYALNKVIEEICAWDENMCFVKNGHITGYKYGAKRESTTFRKHEEVLRKFRMQEINVLVATSNFEECIDIPKCNLVVCFDPPKDYKSYSQSKARARARNASFLMLIDSEKARPFLTELNTYKRIEQVLLRKYINKAEPSKEELIQILEQYNIPQSVVLNTNNNTNNNNNNNNNSSSPITLFSAISIVNRYCAKLPSDAFTHLTPKCTVEKVNVNNETHYVATLKLPINSPVKKDVQGDVMPREKLAKMSAALKMCQELQIQGELDDHFLPVGKEILKHEEKEALKDPLKYGEEDEAEWEEEEEEELIGCPRPGTTKRKQYYFKKAADALINNHVDTNQLCCLYNIHMVLTGPITEEQNTRGRKIYVPENTPRGFGILSLKNIPQVPCFPVYTRSGEVTVSLDMVESNVSINESQLNKLTIFHRFVFSTVLRLEKDPIDFMPDEAKVGYLIVPLIEDDSGHHINWNFVNEVQFSFSRNHPDIYDSKREKFKFCTEDFEDAVVMPSYRNMDQPQHFYVAEIKYDLNPNSPFPSPELYRTFNEYYSKKYGLHITNLEQPLLDVDHTSARLNLLTPRYMNQKGIALPTSSAETKKARRENLQQKQILIPELCVVHIFPASLWRKAVCLPAILYRINYLLIAEEIRVKVAQGTKIGVIEIPKGFHFPKLDFGFETNPEKIIDNKTESEMKVTKAKENGTCTSLSKTAASYSNKLVFKEVKENNELIKNDSENQKDIKEMPVRELVNNVECKKLNYKKPFIKSSSTESLHKNCNKDDCNRPLKDSNRIQEALNAAAGKNNYERREDSVSTSSSRSYNHSEFNNFKSCSVNNSEERKFQPQQFTNKKKHEKDAQWSNDNIKEEKLKEEKNNKSFSKSPFTNLQNSGRIPNGSKMDFKITFDIAKDLNPKDSLDSFKETSEVPSNVKFQNDTLKKDLESLDIRLICDNRSYPEGNAFHQMDKQIRKEKKASMTFSQIDDFYQTKSTKSETVSSTTKIVEITDSEDHLKDNTDKLSNGNCDKSELKSISPTFSPKKDPVCKTSVQNSNNQAGYSPIVETCKELKNNFNNARLHSSNITIPNSNTDSVKDVEEKLCSNSKGNEENLKTCTSTTTFSSNKDQQCNSYTASNPKDSVALHSNSTATTFNPPQEKTLSTTSPDSVSSSSHQLPTPASHSLSVLPEQVCNHSNSSNQSVFNCTQSTSSPTDDDKASSDSEITPCQTEQTASHLQDSTDQPEVAVQDTSAPAPLRDRDQRDVEAVSPPIVIHNNNDDNNNNNNNNINVIQSNSPIDAKVPPSNTNQCTTPLSSHDNAICDNTRHNSDSDVFQNITTFSGQSAVVDMSKISDYGQCDDTTNANLVYSYAEAQEKLAQSSNTPPLLLDTDIELSCYIGPSPCIILQALTMSNANDFFSLERLETIGDSFLKYAITVYLYCQYPGIHEGKLSYLRSKQVSNYNLYRLGRKKGLPERMVSAKFEPYENWLPPGYVINEDRRRGPVHKVHISSSSNKQDPCSPANQCGSESVEEEILSSSFDNEKLSANLNNGMMNFIENDKIPSHVRKANLEQWKFNQELEELKQSQEQDGVSGCGSSTNEKPLVPYSLQTIHSIPDKSVADCVEALIGCYLTCCGKRAALLFMSWLGLKVLPQKHILQEQYDENITEHQLDELETPLSPLLTHTINAEEVLERLLDGYETFEKEIGYKFSDRSYLLQAFTHASYHYNTVTDCYQRLEFLGDAILDYVITRHLYEDSQRYSPGVLTDLRSALVNNNIFAALAVKWNFHKFFKAISPELFNVIERFVARQKEKEDEIDFDEEFQDEGEESPDEEVVEMEIPKALGDIFESVAGAIYLDSNRSLDVVWKVYYRIMKPQIEKYLKSIPKSPVRELLELEPETAKFEKPERTVNGKIRVTVKVAGKGVYNGVGRNYRIAKSAAAKKALRILKTMQSQGFIAQLSNEKMMQG